ncbi:unnamed protein product, partial [Symbiodinium necroappetens]
MVTDWKALLSRTKLPPRELGAWLHVTLMSCPNVGRVLSDETARADFEYNFQVASEHSFTACAQQQEDRKKMDVGTDYTAAACMALGEKAWRELGDNWEKSLYETVETALPCILWHGRQPAGLADFERSFMSCNENADSRPVLSVMLKEQRRLTALKALPALLAWHAVLFEAFEDYGLLREEARQLTNSEAIARLPEHQRAHAEESLNEFCRCFNLAFPLVERLFECEANPFLQQGKVNLPGPMTPETPVIFSLPYVAPSGETEASTLCTVQLANVLQTAQNDLVEAVEAALGIQAENTPALSVSAATEPKIVASLLASLDLRSDLLPLLHQSRKETESCNASVAYDLDQLEEALTQHVRGAVRIQVQLRHYRFGGELKDRLGRISSKRRKKRKSVVEAMPPATNFRRLAALLLLPVQFVQAEQCESASYTFCCELGTPCDCKKGTTSPGQCNPASYGFCCSIGTPCDCSQPPKQPQHVPAEPARVSNVSLPTPQNLPAHNCTAPGDCGLAYEACCAGFAAKGCDCLKDDGHGEAGSSCGDCGAAYAACCMGFKDSGRLAILRQMLPQQPLPFGMVEARGATNGLGSKEIAERAPPTQSLEWMRKKNVPTQSVLADCGESSTCEQRGQGRSCGESWSDVAMLMRQATELLRALVEVFLLVLSAKLAVLPLRGEAKQIIVVRKVHAETPLAELVDASADGAKLPQALHSRAQLCHLQDLYMELVASNHAGDSLAAVALAYQERA